MNTEPVCSGRQVGMGVAAAAAGVLLTSVVALRALTTYRDWVFVLGCGGSVGAGLLVAKLVGQTRPEPPPVDPADNLPLPDDPVLNPLQLALEGRSDGDVSVDQWLCDQNLRLDDVLAQGPKAKALSIVLNDCPAYCEKKVGLSELHTQAMWLKGEMARHAVLDPDFSAIKTGIGQCLENLWDRNDRILRLSRSDKSMLSYSWLTLPSGVDPASYYLKTGGASFVALMQRIDSNWQRMGGSEKLRDFAEEIFAAWHIIHFPKTAYGYCNTYDHRQQGGRGPATISNRGGGFLTYQGWLRPELLIELLTATKNNDWTDQQRKMVFDPDMGLWVGLSKRQRLSVVEGCGPENYRLVTELIWDLDSMHYGDAEDLDPAGELAKKCMENVTNLEQLCWCCGKEKVGSPAKKQFKKLVESEASRASMIPEINEMLVGEAPAQKQQLHELLAVLSADERSRVVFECLKNASSMAPEKKDQLARECLPFFTSLEPLIWVCDQMGALDRAKERFVELVDSEQLKPGLIPEIITIWDGQSQVHKKQLRDLFAALDGVKKSHFKTEIQAWKAKGSDAPEQG